MSAIEMVPVPAWVSARQSTQSTDHAKLCYLIRLAALFHNETGSIADLATACGMSGSTLHMAMKRGQVTGEIAVAIETQVGRTLFPRELFRPDLFTLPVEG